MVKKESEKTALKLHIQKAKTMASGPITSWQMMGKKWKHRQNTSFSLAPKSLWMVTAARKLKYACSLEESYEKPRHSVYKALYMEYIYHFTHKVPYSQSFGFSSSHVWMWELDHKESWAPKNWCFWTVVLEKTLESPLDCKEIQPIHSKGDQSWVFFGRNDAKAPILCPPHVKSWLIGKDPDAGRDWGQEEKGMTEDEMAGWHHWLNGRESEWTPGDGDGQGGLACCDTTERLNLTELNPCSLGFLLLQDFTEPLCASVPWQS